jgi:glycerophosphoryl diester phosphodiesterase
MDIVAHRGASYDAPENTLAAYRLAWRQNADAIEGDFCYSLDKQIVCMHDATTDRTAGHKAKIADLTFADIRQLDAGSWKDPRFQGEPIPTLAEVLALVPKDKRLFLEIKIGPPIVPDIQRQIEASGLKSGQIVIISFDEKVIAAAKAAMPSIKACWLYSFKKKDGAWSITHDELISRLRASKADGLDVGFTSESQEIVNEALSRKLREAGLELHVWTVDDPALARRAIERGTLSITTNRPQWLRRELGLGK